MNLTGGSSIPDEWLASLFQKEPIFLYCGQILSAFAGEDRLRGVPRP
jgi:hypothetical protein